MPRSDLIGELVGVAIDVGSESQTGTEWPANLDVGALLEEGWRPTAFRQFIVKVHGHCNLACDYCYLYEMADQGWRTRPRRMSRPVVERTAARIAEHIRDHGLTSVDIILHGGEPLLAGVDHLRHTLATLRAAVPGGVECALRIQTNGTLLDTPFLELLAEFDVRVGVSLDGDEAGHDRHRRRKGGRGSHADVRAGLERLTAPRYRHLFGGLLCTIDLRNDPVATYEALLAFDPPMVDFHLPHGTWDTPPPGRLPGDPASPYGDWLAAVFDRWYRAPVRETRVRMFGEIIRLLLGRPSRTESVGLSPAAMVVVETDGSLEQVDSLKAAYDGAAATPLHVLRDAFDAALLLPPVVARQIGVRALSERCTACALHPVCGGGLYPHRHRAGSGFRNPSVYCPDLYRLITHIHAAVARDVAALRKGGR
ncbi:FxsB family cyclophane-forming radical SAM/SPASM peptide maturase [Actinomadura kijaniata]|uniref:FxsB family cyclophane-forming radical SAM/SPASM peptide maturase n=1 Tax=Actinomadura kijaniata TaxID=46161 RepID=UPI000AEA988F